MAEEEDDSSKTEDPSQKKLDDALKKGQVVNSKEITSFILFTLLTVTTVWVFPPTLKLISSKLRYLVENAGQIPITQGAMYNILPYYMKKMLLYLSPIFAITIIAAVFSTFAQSGTFVFSAESLKPDISKLSLIKGFKRIVSVKSLVEFLKGIFKIILVGTLVYLVILADIKELSQYQELSVGGIIDQMETMVFHILLYVTITMAAIAGVDFTYQKYEHFNKLKMTKQEVKEEYKQTEGNPEIKQKMRKLQSEQSKKRVAQAVPEATVVITNPEHYAVALKYEANVTDAPVCVMKGLDLVAQKIKAIAEDNDIPIVESPPLARALYKDVDVDNPIPEKHYEAVAKILTYIMSLEEKRKQQKKNG